MKRVVITGIGIVSPFGVGKKVLFENLCANKIALRSDEQLKTVVGRVAVSGNDGLDLSSWTSRELKQMSRGWPALFLPVVFCTKIACLLELLCIKFEVLSKKGVNVGISAFRLVG